MRYTTIEFAGKEFKLRLGAAQIMELEKHLGGRNPLDVLMMAEKGSLPSLTATLRILHAAMQRFHHGITFQDVANLYDEYVESGNSYIDLIPNLLEVFKVSGFFKVAETETENKTAIQ